MPMSENVRRRIPILLLAAFMLVTIFTTWARDAPEGTPLATARKYALLLGVALVAASLVTGVIEWRRRRAAA